MKRFLLPLLLLLSSMSAFAQEDKEAMNEKFFEAKIREFVYRLELSDEQKAQFVPIYKRYSEEMRSALGKPVRGKEKPQTSAEAAELAKARIEHQQKAQEIKLKYIDEFASVLEPEQLERLFKVENQIQQKLMKRKNGKGNDKFDGKRPDKKERPDKKNRQNKKNRLDFEDGMNWE